MVGTGESTIHQKIWASLIVGFQNTYYAAQLWMTGGYNFTDDGPPQPMIPIIAYWDDYDKVPWALPHVYDYMEGWDAVSRTYPLLGETYNRRRYLTAYSKQQKLNLARYM